MGLSSAVFVYHLVDAEVLSIQFALVTHLSLGELGHLIIVRVFSSSFVIVACVEDVSTIDITFKRPLLLGRLLLRSLVAVVIVIFIVSD